jgi:hypothetical protein
MLSQVNSILKYLSIISLAIGLVVSFVGFSESYNTTWATSSLASGVSWLLFGIALLVLGTGLAVLARE